MITRLGFIIAAYLALAALECGGNPFAESTIVNRQSSIPPIDTSERDAWHEETRRIAEEAESRSMATAQMLAAVADSMSQLVQELDELSRQVAALPDRSQAIDLYYCLDFAGGTRPVAGFGEYLPIIPGWPFAQRLSSGALDWHLPDAAKVLAFIRDELKLSEWFAGRIVIDNECWTKGVTGPAIATALDRSIAGVRAACPRAEVWVYVPGTEVFDDARPALANADGIYLPNHSGASEWNAAQLEVTRNRIIKACSLGKPVIVQVMQEVQRARDDPGPPQLFDPDVILVRVQASLAAETDPGQIVGICIFAAADTITPLDYTRELLRQLDHLLATN